MTDTRVPSTPSEHADHDRIVIASLAARPADLSGAERATAERQLDACAACSDLLAELVAVQVAIPGAALPIRPRDYTLTPADAARLGRGGWRRFLATIGSARDGVTRPLAIGLTTLGLAGLLVSSLPGAFGAFGAAGAAPQVAMELDQGRSSAAPAAPGASESYALGANPRSSPVPEGGFVDGGTRAVDPSDDPGPDIASAPEDSAIRDDASGLSTLMVLAGVATVLGLGLFGLRWSARRFGDG